MSFDTLPLIERADTYLDNAFKKARKKPADKRIDTVSDYLTSSFEKIIAVYPNFDNMSEFYTQLLKLTVDYDKLKRAMGACQWIVRQVKTVSSEFRREMRSIENKEDFHKKLKAYYGRISSILHQTDKQLSYLKKVRDILRSYPSIKEGVFTIAIAGFPNVGKSTLLGKVTGAKPEIDSYAFTTKGLNMGTKTISAIKFQFIDTPGTLNRVDKMNDVEKQAHIAIRYAADLIMYVFDLTETCGYSIEEQLKLYEKLKSTRKPVVIYLSKTDLYTEKTEALIVQTFSRRKVDMLVDSKSIKDYILNIYRKINS